MKQIKGTHYRTNPLLTVVPFLYILCVLIVGGCATPGGKALESHKKGIESALEDEYVASKMPIDQPYIGCAWSRQFGPIEDPDAADIRVRKERSLDSVQQGFARSLGFMLGAEPIPLSGIAGETGARAGKVDMTRLEGVEIISTVSLSDIPFEPGIPYVTESLRLANFRLKKERAAKAAIGLGTPSGIGGRTTGVEAGGDTRAGTEGEGLVVAYKLQAIDRPTYLKQDSGTLPLELDKGLDLPKFGLVVKARLQVIEPGSGKSLPRNLLWACPRAEAQSRNAVAAWLVDLRPTERNRKALTIAFPAYPAVDECQNFSGVIYSKIDPVTDRIIRQKIQLTLVDAELSHALQPERWEARLSVVDESFKIKLVRPSDLEAGTY